MATLKNQIYIGSLSNPTYYFENDLIHGGLTVTQSVAMVGQELMIDKFEPIVSDSEDNLANVTRFYSSDDMEIMTLDHLVYAIDVEEDAVTSGIINLAVGTPVWYYNDDKLVGKFYVSNVIRQARNQFKIECVSAIGMLDTMYHGGGLFTTATFSSVLSHILAENIDGTGDAVIAYSIDDDVAALTVSGWLPYASKRENLHQLIFAYGVNILKDANGNPRFTFVHTAPTTVEEISTSKIYNTGSMEYERPYSKVSILEHTYIADSTQDAVTLFDNTSGSLATSEEVVFTSAPIIVSSLTADGTLTISSSSVNRAVVSGNGKLTGIPYVHTTRNVTKVNASGDVEKTASVNDCTLVNTVNSTNLLNRLYAFYCPTDFIKKISDSIVYNDERCGKAYKITNPYGESETAFLASMDITASSFNKADCTWYSGYTPAGQEGLYQHVMILDVETYEESGGVFTVPDGVTSIKVIMIGGGTGGSSGYPGENGDDAYTYTNVSTSEDLSAKWYGAEGGEGGSGGPGGSAGKVKSVVINNPSATYNYTIGSGGVGGNATGFIKDTVAELRRALENENPGTTYTDAQIQAMIDTESTTWNGTPNAGTAGTATTFDSYSTADADAYTPTGGVYDPIKGTYYALTGGTGTKGGKGGARQVNDAWVTDGESVTHNGTTYAGGSTGTILTTVTGLSEASIKAYGGNGAGAAVGLAADSSHTHMNGGSDQTTSWSVTEDT